jgi:hypothetical protein
MRNAKGYIAGIVCVASMIVAPGIFAGEGYILVGGTRAVIEGRQLILVEGESSRKVASYGVYQIRGEDQAIYVTANGIEIRRRPAEIR